LKGEEEEETKKGNITEGVGRQNKKLYEDWQPKENGRAPTKRFPLTSDPSMS
jgi:hypothetical protein